MSTRTRRLDVKNETQPNPPSIRGISKWSKMPDVRTLLKKHFKQYFKMSTFSGIFAKGIITGLLFVRS
jgi:hypothetical protein